MNGALGKDMMPDLSSLSISGFLQTIKSTVAGLKSLEDVANKLNISELKNMDLNDTKNWFEVANGVVTVKEFDKKLKDINLKISGTHSLTNEMNYSIKAQVPRKKLEANAVGAAVGSGLNVLLAEAAKYGVNIKNSEFVNVAFNITGSMLSPKVSMKLLGGDGETSVADAAKGAANAIINKAKDSVTTRANEELDKYKAKAKEAADRALDSATRVAQAKVDEVKQKAIDEAKKRASEALDKQMGDKAGKRVGDEIDKQLEKTGGGGAAKKEADKLKDQLNKWDPFGKKKKAEVPKDSTGN